MLHRRQTNTPKLLARGADKLKTTVVKTAGPLAPVNKSPDEQMGALFDAVQHGHVFPDGKTFLDLIPREKAKQLAKEYEASRHDPNFEVRDFVAKHFDMPFAWTHEYHPDHTTTTRQHVTNLWQVLRRRNRRNRGSLIAEPHDYIVPGGRFSEQFYWDSYFVMLGLAADNEWSLIEGMIRNHAYVLRRFGLIPTANRTYFLSRSQPPFFVHMVRLLGEHKGKLRTYTEFLPSMLAEYRFWMKGRKIVMSKPEIHAYARVVYTPSGTVLNRYFDNKTTPRPESLTEDVETAGRTDEERRHRIFLDLRAGAESGWDFSSRWLRGERNMQTIHTTDMVPVDLNCLLYQLEHTLAETYEALHQPRLARRFRAAADARAIAIRQYCWNESKQFFTDYDFRAGRSSNRMTLAGVFPLYAGIATKDQADRVAAEIQESFLKPGGLVTTLINSGQQWDSPNGWAPLQWIAIQGLRRYGYEDLANTIRERWLATCDALFASERRMVEKYDVVNGGVGSGGEYLLQDGFGWTNGVYAALYDERQAGRHGE